MEGSFSQESLPFLRPLGHLEKYSTTRSHLGIYLNVGVTARYKRPRGECVKPRLFHALGKLILKHPILCAIPFGVGTPNPYFIRLPVIALNDVVTFVEEDAISASSDWQEVLDKVLEQQHNLSFEEQPTKVLPFWRIYVLENKATPTSFTLVFIFHHSIMDTKSAVSLHREIEEYMARPTAVEPCDTIYSSPEGLIPPIERLHSFPISQEFLQSQDTPSEPAPEMWTGSRQFIPVKTRFSSMWISDAETKILAARSKMERTSVTAALQTLLAACIFAVLPPTYNSLQADCAVSLRNLLPEPVTDTTLGCYVGSLSTTYIRRPFFDWDEVRRTKMIIDRTIARKGADMMIGYLAHIPNQHDWMLQKLGRKRMSAFELSNVGTSTTLRGASDFAIESMLFSQSASACSAAIKVSVVTGPDGRLALGFTWQEGAIESDMIARLKVAVRGEIQELTSSTRVQ